MSATICVQNAFHFGVAWLLANKNQNSKTVIERRPKHKRQKKNYIKTYNFDGYKYKISKKT